MNESQLNELKNIKKCKFKDFIDFQSGVDSKNNVSNIAVDNSLPWVKLSSLENKRIKIEKCEYLINEHKNIAYPNDLLVCWSTNAGLSVRVGFKCLFSTAFYKFANKENNIINNYLYYWFEKNISIIKSMTDGSTLKKINMKKFGEISISYPNILLQKKISDFFELLDKQIELYETKLQLNELIELHFLDQLFKMNKLEVCIKDLVIKTSNINKMNIKYRHGCISKLKGVIFQDSFFKKEIKSKKLTSHKILYENEYVYNPARINIGSIARNRTQEALLFSPMYDSFKLTDIQNIDMFDIFFKSNIFISRCKQLASGSVRNTLSWDDFSSIKIFNPKNLKYDYIKLLKKLKYNTEFIRENIWNLNIKKTFYIKKMFI